MLCRKPFVRGLSAFGCGQCTPCRINRRRLWTHRLWLEFLSAESGVFVTLTYDKENLPPGGSLQPEVVRDFVKRLREAVRPRLLRFFLCGEYGDETFRPHYHAIFFGLSVLDEEVIRKCWKLGFIAVGDVTLQSIAYTCGYVIKKMTKSADPRLQGKVPEFARMSLRPGIGAKAMKEVSAALQSASGAKLVSSLGDVPGTLSHGRKKLPLGRYLTRQLRAEMGFEELGAQGKGLEERRKEVQAVRDVARTHSAKELSAALVKFNEPRIVQSETRAKIWSKKGKL